MSDPPETAAFVKPPPCPFCGGRRTEVMSLFGSHASLTTCWCADCRSPFEFLRWRDAAPGGDGDGGGDPAADRAPDRHLSGEERNMDPGCGVD